VSAPVRDLSGYLGSIGFGFPAAMGAWAAATRRKVVSVSGDGGFGQYLAEMTTAVKYGMDITHVLLNNGELGKVSKEQRDGEWKVWQTSCTTRTSPTTPVCVAQRGTGLTAPTIWPRPCNTRVRPRSRSWRIPS